MPGNIRIGTSGWHYPHWRGPFYPADLPAGQMLEFYVRHFSSVEVNNSFYRLPTSAALQSWRNTTPNDFCFAVKASRFLTHMKKLKDPETGLAKFLARVEQLGEKLGPSCFSCHPAGSATWKGSPVFWLLCPKVEAIALSCVTRAGTFPMSTVCSGTIMWPSASMNCQASSLPFKLLRTSSMSGYTDPEGHTREAIQQLRWRLGPADSGNGAVG